MILSIITGRVRKNNKIIGNIIFNKFFNVVFKTVLLSFMKKIIYMGIRVCFLNILMNDCCGCIAITVTINYNQNAAIAIQNAHKEFCTFFNIIQQTWMGDIFTIGRHEIINVVNSSCFEDVFTIVFFKIFVYKIIFHLTLTLFSINFLNTSSPLSLGESFKSNKFSLS